MPPVIDNYLSKLSPSDRLAVVVLTFFMVLSLGGLMALNLHRAAEKAQQQAMQEKALQAWFQSHIPLLSKNAVNKGLSVLDTVSASAGGLGINMKRFEPDGEQVRVWLENADFAKVANWLNRLNEQGVQAQEVHFEQGVKGLSVRLVFGR